MTGPYNEDDLEEDQARDVSGNRESLDPSDTKESSIYRFLRQLERYYVVCLIATLELGGRCSVTGLDDHDHASQEEPVSRT